MAAFTMTDTQQVSMTIQAVDKHGHPATMPAGTISWGVDLDTVIALTPAADNLSCVAAAVGILGTATVSVKVSDPGGVTLAAGSLDFTITGGAATAINIQPGAPTEQP